MEIYPLIPAGEPLRQTFEVGGGKFAITNPEISLVLLMVAAMIAGMMALISGMTCLADLLSPKK
jgi:hypothetical protein